MVTDKEMKEGLPIRETIRNKGKMKKTEKGWAILNNHHGLYIGWWLTKRAAIEGHTEDVQSSWKDCKKRGDKAVKIEITYES